MILGRVSRHNYRGREHNALTLFGPYIYRQSLGVASTLPTSKAKKGQNGDKKDLQKGDDAGWFEEDQPFCWRRSQHGKVISCPVRFPMGACMKCDIMQKGEKFMKAANLPYQILK